MSKIFKVGDKVRFVGEVSQYELDSGIYVGAAGVVCNGVNDFYSVCVQFPDSIPGYDGEHWAYCMHSDLEEVSDAYQGHAGTGGLQNHSVGDAYAAGFIVVAVQRPANLGYYALQVSTGRKSQTYDLYDDAELAGFEKEFSLDADPVPFTAGRGFNRNA